MFAGNGQRVEVLKQLGNAEGLGNKNDEGDEDYMLVSEEQRRVSACVCIHVGPSSLQDAMLDDQKEILQETEVASSWSIWSERLCVNS